MLSPFVRQKLCTLFSLERSKEDLQLLKELVEAGKVRPIIDRTYPLSEVAEAIRYWEEGHARGENRHHRVSSQGVGEMPAKQDSGSDAQEDPSSRELSPTQIQKVLGICVHRSVATNEIVCRQRLAQ